MISHPIVAHVDIFITGSFLSTLGVPLIRTYRAHKILVKKSTDMWSPRQQYLTSILAGLATLSLFITIRVVFDGPEFQQWDYVCPYDPWAPGTALDTIFQIGMTIGLLGPVLGFTIALLVYTIKMRHYRRFWLERNESLLTALLFILLVAVIRPLVFGSPQALSINDWDNLFLMVYVWLPLTAYWVAMVSPTWHLYWKSDAYLKRYTFGFDQLPTPAQLHSSLEEQLTHPVVREMFREHSKTRFAVENVEFWEEVRDLAIVVNFQERQVRAMKIIDTFIREDGPTPINIAGSTRQAILRNSNVVEPTLFSKAMQEVFAIMETDLRDGFIDSKAVNAATQAASHDLETQRNLAKAGLAPSFSSILPANKQKPARE